MSIKDMIDNIDAGNKSAASDIFQDAMLEKAQDAIAIERIRVASSFLNPQEETDEEYINEADADDYKAPKDSDEEATEYKPRSKGEQEFKDMHKGGKKDHPASEEGQHTSNKKQSSHLGAPGEKSVVNPIKK